MNTTDPTALRFLAIAQEMEIYRAALEGGDLDLAARCQLNLYAMALPPLYRAMVREEGRRRADARFAAEPRTATNEHAGGRSPLRGGAAYGPKR